MVINFRTHLNSFSGEQTAPGRVRFQVLICFYQCHYQILLCSQPLRSSLSTTWCLKIQSSVCGHQSLYKITVSSLGKTSTALSFAFGNNFYPGPYFPAWRQRASQFGIMLYLRPSLSFPLELGCSLLLRRGKRQLQGSSLLGEGK